MAQLKAFKCLDNRLHNWLRNWLCFISTINSTFGTTFSSIFAFHVDTVLLGILLAPSTYIPYPDNNLPLPFAAAPPPPLPSRLQLAAFHSVATGGSSKAASMLLGVSQPNISKLISSLEHALGAALVRQRGSAVAGKPGVHLSEAGQLLLMYTHSMAHAVAETSRYCH